MVVGVVGLHSAERDGGQIPELLLRVIKLSTRGHCATQYSRIREEVILPRTELYVHATVNAMPSPSVHYILPVNGRGMTGIWGAAAPKVGQRRRPELLSEIF